MFILKYHIKCYIKYYIQYYNILNYTILLQMFK